ncbi:shikimate dehydrogenase [Oceaniovalibus sp. ACAM 378]|jgi:shikimate dehydrogenase|uniref:shikimate dehydrogenase n=1 Tax=Oceaniovalibus sp. ACAM 378 TaxID=2599923 RepID=UPI0011D3B30B|nr:shikimate dehydrogenase [Oceaniovalibus sp. ACAM 378]TYB86434.1 shikimate dehydrogenase [Oceaniovalibus sp. ACAM 378]
MTEAKIPLAGVIGSPIAHSRSPALHQHWLRTLGLRGFYIPMDVAQSNLAEVIRALPKMGFVGCNVTIPHKEAVLELADLVTDRAALIGAANTLIFRADGKIHADNTDGYGFIQNLRQSAPGWDAKSGPAAVFGAGGAARAVITSLIDAGVPEIRLTNRTRARSEALRAEFGGKIVVYDWVKAGNALDEAQTVVNASSLGMQGKPDFRVPLDGLSSTAVVSDLVYTPLDTTFLQRAREFGCVTVDGLGMLIYQAAPAFERWFGMRPEVDARTREVVLGG